mgnify:CR=1 FL=1
MWVPSFGEWGYVLASVEPLETRHVLPTGLKFLNEETLPSLFQFPQDMGPVPAEVNKLNNQVLVHYYENEWKHWN